MEAQQTPYLIKPVNPYIDQLQEHPLLLRDLAEVWQHFKEKPALIDLGCGNGHFLAEKLTRQPEFKALGVDLRYKRLYKTAEKLRRLTTTGSYVIRHEVIKFVIQSPPKIWDEVWLQFPDPWPKDRHAKNRMLRQQLFMGIFRSLKPGGRLCFRSDCEAYWEFLQEIHAKTHLFGVSICKKGDLFENEPKTLFQEKFEDKSIPIFSMELRKVH